MECGLTGLGPGNQLPVSGPLGGLCRRNQTTTSSSKFLLPFSSIQPSFAPSLTRALQKRRWFPWPKDSRVSLLGARLHKWIKIFKDKDWTFPFVFQRFTLLWRNELKMRKIIGPLLSMLIEGEQECLSPGVVLRITHHYT